MAACSLCHKETPNPKTYRVYTGIQRCASLRLSAKNAKEPQVHSFYEHLYAVCPDCQRQYNRTIRRYIFTLPALTLLTACLFLDWLVLGCSLFLFGLGLILSRQLGVESRLVRQAATERSRIKWQSKTVSLPRLLDKSYAQASMGIVGYTERKFDRLKKKAESSRKKTLP